MSGKLPVCTPKEVLRALEKAGWTVQRRRGSHVFLTGPLQRVVVLPMHTKDLPSVTLHRIIRDAGLSVEAFADLL